MNFSADDRRRSLRRFLTETLPSPPWVIRTEPEVVADERRPVGIIEAVGPTATTRARATVPQGDVEKAQSYAVSLYPPLPAEVAAGKPAPAAVARLAADELGELIEQAITVGLVHADGSSWSYPLRLPVFDFAGVPVVGSGRGGPAVPYGFLWVESFGVESLSDPDDSRRWMVGLSLRVSWEQGGRLVAPAPIVAPGGVHAGGFTP